MRNQVQLITYVDRLAGTLRGLTELLQGPLAGLFGGVHVLPFYTPIDGADAGFDPTDHTEVDPRLGTWQDVAELTRVVDVMADVVVNHVSSRSAQFRDFLAHGERSEFAGMFLTFDGVFPHGAAESDLVRLYRPRPGLPFTRVTLGDDTGRIVWTTFTNAQIDLDVRHPATVAYLQSVLDRLASAGVRMARLDAVGYAVKTPGTSCFLTAETFAFVDDLHSWATERHIEVLVEIHSHYEQQIAIAPRVDRVYDFALSPLVLHGLSTGDAEPLQRWLSIRPANAVTILDTHDGIGVRDVGRDVTDPKLAGLLTDGQIDALVERIHDNTGGQSREATGSAASNVDLYQVNSTYYDALARDDRAYLLARLLQFFTPGIPQVYYIGLLAGTNDMELLAASGVGRDINRHRYGPDELAAALEKPVVRALLAVIRFRNTHPAFDGSWTFRADGPSGLEMHWRDGTHEAMLTADLAAGTYEVSFTQEGSRRSVTDVADLADDAVGPDPGA
jgi:sucrose phosphorylase